MKDFFLFCSHSVAAMACLPERCLKALGSSSCANLCLFSGSVEFPIQHSAAESTIDIITPVFPAPSLQPPDKGQHTGEENREKGSRDQGKLSFLIPSFSPFTPAQQQRELSGHRGLLLIQFMLQVLNLAAISLESPTGESVQKEKANNERAQKPSVDTQQRTNSTKVSNTILWLKDVSSWEVVMSGTEKEKAQK